MAKRGAGSYLTDRNWDEEDEQEEPGNFSEASDDVLKNRPIKKAKRRGFGETSIDSGGSTAAFSSFKGFSMPKSSPTPNVNFGGQSLSRSTSKTSPLATTSESTTSQSEISSFSVQSKNTSPKKLTNGQSKPSSDRNKYLHQLKCLNEAVAKWIKEHVDSTPYCILTPIFADYEKHLKEIDTKYNVQSGEHESTDDSKGNISGKDPGKDTTDDEPKSMGFTFKTDKKSDSEPSGFSFTSGFSSTTSSSATTSGFSSAASTSATTSGFKFSESLGESKTMQGFSFAPKATTSIAGASPFFAVSKPSAATSNNAPAETTEEDEYVPPKPDVDEVKEDDAFYTKRCKLFFKKENNWVEKGVGNLHLKDCSGKTQLLVRADTSLGNILLNIMVSSTMPASRQGKNNVAIMCVPNPPLDEKKADDKTPVGMLIRVKTGDDADELFDEIKKAKTK